MIACLRLTHLAAALLRQHDPALAGLPLVIGGQAWESAPVVALSAEAYASGVRVGMPLKQAGALCPGAHFLPPDEVRWREAQAALLERLWDFSDCVEPPAEPFRTVHSDFFLDPGGLHPAALRALAEALHRAVLAQCSVAARIGLAANRFTAQAAAACGDAVVSLVPPGAEAVFLAPLPVALLPLEGVHAHRLALLGIQTLGQFAALPRGAMLTQFGLHGPLLHRLARGQDSRGVTGLPRPRSETLTYECEPPVDDLQLIQAILARMSAGLAARLAAQDLTCPEVQLTLELRRGEVVTVRHRPRDPLTNAPDLLRLLLRLLDQQTLSSPVYGLAIHLRDLQPVRARQLSLFGDDLDVGRIAPEMLERLAARHGPDLFYEVRRAELPTSPILPDAYRLASVVA